MSANSDDPNNNRSPRGRKNKAAMKNRDSSEEEEEESDASGGEVAARAPVVNQERMVGQENEDDEADAGVGSSYQYRDRSRDVSSNLKTGDGEDDDGTELTHSSLQAFPVKLHRILSNAEYQEIVCWLPHGRAWRILQLKAFEDKVLPLYFRHGRHASFARQVNGWGFRRITSGPDYNAYYHELFLRGFPKLCKRMKRLTSKDIANRHQEDSPLPDFYALSRDHPLPELPESGSPPPPAEPAAAGVGIHHASSIVAAAAGDGVPQRDALETRRSEIVQRLENLLNCTQGEALLAAVGLAAGGGALAATALPPAMTTSNQSNPSSGWGSLAQNPSSLSNVAATPEAQTLALINSLLQQTSAGAKPAPTFPAPATTASAVPSISDVLALIGRAASGAPTTTVAAQSPQPPAASNPADMLGILQRLMAGSQPAVSVAPQQGFQLQQALHLGQHGANALISPLQVQFQLQQDLQRGQGGQQGDLLRYLQNQALGGAASGFYQAQAPSSIILAPNPFGFAFGQQQAPYGFATTQAPSLVGYLSMNAASSGVTDMAGNININQILNLMQQQQGNQQQQPTLQLQQEEQQKQQQQTLQQQQEEQKQQKQDEEEDQQQDEDEEKEEEEEKEKDEEEQKPPAVAAHSSTSVLQPPSQPNDMVTALSGLDPAQTAALLQQLQSQLLANSSRPGNVLSPPPSATTATGGTSTTTSSDSDNQGNRQNPLAAALGGNGGAGISGGGGAAGGDANANLILSILAAMNNTQQNK